MNILLVEDSPHKIEKVKNILTELGYEHELTIVQNVVLAMAKLSEIKYDLLVLDICLPQREGESPKDDGGIALLDELYMMNDEYQVPPQIIALTEYSNLQERFEGKFSHFRALIFDSTSVSWQTTLKSMLTHIQRSSITEEERLFKLISEHENNLVERKATLQFCLNELRNMPYIEHTAMKTIAAFANANGGTLFIGVSDDGTIKGTLKYENEDKLLRTFDNIVKEFIGNFANAFIKTKLLKVNNHTILAVKVGCSKNPIYLKRDDKKKVIEEGAFYIRRANSSVKLDGDERDTYFKERFSLGS